MNDPKAIPFPPTSTSASASATSSAPGAELSPLKRAFLALEAAQAKVARLEQAAREPIAIVGIGCRLPGGADDAAGFWRLMGDGVDASSRIPADRWDAEATFDADPAVPGRIATQRGGFLNGPVDTFDAAFFGISPREAQGMDPQQRLLLEVAWEALEHAGCAPDRLERSPTGVFVGVTSSDYTYLQLESGDPALLDAHFTSGIAHSIASGRLSYLLGLQGPSLSIDTACSSSLVAVHLACQSLRSGESRMALAGGVNLILAPQIFIALSHSRMLAPDGRCKTFDAAADGFARGEGCAMVVLKRLADAQTDGDRVLAVIRGSAVNQDGPSSGLTAPSGPAQEAVVREALARAQLAPRQVGYIEAHGTGTQLGDPLEVQALGAVFGADRPREQPLLIGSVKTNIGHLEGAAGVTGLVKLVLALQQRTIPPHLHFRQPSPHIPWSEWPLAVPTEATPWPAIDGRRIGGVSSFGFSGTNAHVIVEEAAAPNHAVAAAAGPAFAEEALAARSAHVLALAARDAGALAALAARHLAALQGLPEDKLPNYVHTAHRGRALGFAHRATFVVRNLDELRRGLHALAEGRAADEADSLGDIVRTAVVTRRDPPRLAFLFTGQGAQYTGMARTLYRAAPGFRQALDEAAAALAPHLPQPLLPLMFGSEGGSANPLLDQTQYTQAALWALELALARWCRTLGVVPQAAMGHSVGEVTAATLAGVLSVEDAAALIAARGRLMQALPAGGAMAAVMAPEGVVTAQLGVHAARVAIAAVNGPAQTVVSGAAEAVAALCQSLAQAGVRCQPLAVSHAFHSPLMEPMLAAFEATVAALPLKAPQLRLVSNVSGQAATTAELTSAAYWRRHVRQPVRFADGLRALVQVARPDLLLELGPHPTLSGFASATLGDAGPPRLALLRKGRDDWAECLHALAALYRAGVAVNWAALDEGLARHVVDVPTYPFQRERHWFVAAPRSQAGTGTSPSTPPAAPGTARSRDSGHPLLGRRWLSAGREVIFEAEIAADRPAWVQQHRVQGQVIVPGTAYLDTLHAAATRLLGDGPVEVADVTLREALRLDDAAAPGEAAPPRCLQWVATPAPAAGSDAPGWRIALSSRSAEAASAAGDAGDDWIEHVSATLRPPVNPTAAPATALAEARAACPHAVQIDGFYAAFEPLGLQFGPAFHSVRELWRSASDAPHGSTTPAQAQALGRVELQDALHAEAASHATLHPVLLDGAVQVLSSLLTTPHKPQLYLPVGLAGWRWHPRAGAEAASHEASGPVHEVFSHVRLLPATGSARRAEVRLFAADGRPLGELLELQLQPVSADALARLSERWLDQALYRWTWRDAPLEAGTTSDAAAAGPASAAVATLDAPAAAAAAEQTLPEQRERAGIPAYDQFLPRFEAWCARQVLFTLHELGWSPAVGEVVTDAAALATRLGIAARHQRLFARLLGILAEEGWLAPARTSTPASASAAERDAPRGGWRLARSWPALDAAAHAAHRAEADPLRALCPDAAAEIDLTLRVTHEFAAALCGRREPADLLFPGGSLETTERLYRDSPTARFFNGLVAELAAQIGAAAGRTGAGSAAGKRPLRVLELGAGTGGTTAHVLPRLPQQGVEYTFTDIGALFVARARERFGPAAPFMRFATLNLERDPQAQGFAAGGYDLILASNVIHATADLKRTLGHVHNLLAEGGLLVMLEVTAPQRWFDLTVGLTEGWWAFTDTELRPDYATLPRPAWQALLTRCGFASEAALPQGAQHGGVLGLQSVLVARKRSGAAAATAQSAPMAGVPPAAPWLVLARPGGLGEALCRALRADGRRVLQVVPGERPTPPENATSEVTSQATSQTASQVTVRPGHAEDWAHLLGALTEAGRRPPMVVHAWSLDDTLADAFTVAELQRRQTLGVISAMQLSQALLRAGGGAPARLALLTQAAVASPAIDATQAPLWGFARAVALEHPELGCTCIDVDASEGARHGAVRELGRLAAEAGGGPVAAPETQVRWRGADAPHQQATQPATQPATHPATRQVARLVPMPRRARAIAPTAPWRLAPQQAGSLDRFVRQPMARRAPGPGEVEIAVRAAGLNFKDVLITLGVVPGQTDRLGGECAGTVVAVGPGVSGLQAGDAVLAVAWGAFASHVVAKAHLTHPLPPGLSWEEGAAFPIAYLTAHFCLGHLARLNRGERVLVHAGAGGVGLAAVRLAQRAGAEVFATAGSAAKRALLRSLGVAHVFDSRSAGFGEEVQAATGGHGVDVVLNSLSGDALIEASFAATARGGRFVEIGKRGIKSEAWVRSLGRDIEYHVVDWSETAESDPALVGRLLGEMVQALARGALPALPRHVFAIGDNAAGAAQALRFMAQARHVGKIVLRLGGGPSAAADGAAHIRGDGSYLVTGGLSGLGLVVAGWLAERGAGRLVLVGRRGPTAEAAPLIEAWRARGVPVLAQALDVADEAALGALLQRLRTDGGPPLRGVVHSAGALADAALLQQDRARYDQVFAAKLLGTLALENGTRADALDFFVLFSSVAAVLGSAGQSNHSAANAFLDQWAAARRQRGLPGLAINWGPWSEVGAAVDRGAAQRLAAQGITAITPAQGLQAMSRLMALEADALPAGGQEEAEAQAQAVVLPVQWARYAQRLSSAATPAWLNELAKAGRAGGFAGSAADAAPGRGAASPRPESAAGPADRAAPVTESLAQQLLGAPASRRRPLMATFVRERALRALGLAPSRAIDPGTPLGELGLDSLLAVELRNTLASGLGRALPATLLFDHPTIDALTDHLLNELLGHLSTAPSPLAGAPAAPSPAPASTIVESIEELSDEEVERMLAQRSRSKAGT
ncbi:MAG: SDR family NAD(P)-dependent oxidoreductase [Rubrivivax sp.]|nr:SDR family NAD(P)-dependent oxidoreductase [Rubrivivax sp.]